MQIPEAVIITAHRFAVHTQACPACKDVSRPLCPHGRLLLRDFQHAKLQLHNTRTEKCDA